MGQLNRAESPYRFRIPEDLIPVLRELRSRQKPWSDVVDAEDVVHLFYGLGPALFLAFDGRVIIDEYDNLPEQDAVYEVVEPKQAWVAVAIGARRLGVPDLCRLLPERPTGVADCPRCNGSGRFLQTRVVCWECGTLGWCRTQTLKQARHLTAATRLAPVCELERFSGWCSVVSAMCEEVPTFIGFDFVKQSPDQLP